VVLTSKPRAAHRARACLPLAQLRQSSRDTPAAFVCEDFRTSLWSGNNIRYRTVKERESLIRSQSQRYFEAAQNPEEYLNNLDEDVSRILQQALKATSFLNTNIVRMALTWVIY
jgi:hypothetical protein